MWKIKHIFDGDYGCEERACEATFHASDDLSGDALAARDVSSALAPGEKPKVSVTIVNDADEEKRISVEDDWLTENNLDVGSEWPEE